MRPTYFEARCPGCDRRLHAPNHDALDKQAARHVRNCGAFRRAAALLDDHDKAELLAIANATEGEPG